ncbi:FAD-dependent monooxygenase [Phenylobacterium sp. LjRoot219]|uniref:FAD-dependent monooxygenase n=1 Tax=Phenylobacterium sp. LjRoot219 TaxID=3342283 RepID=UPI003ECFE4C7
MPNIETPVLIVGGGPVGLALAVELGWRGVACVLAEKDGPDARRTHPRMDAVGIRTMEFARRWGLVDDIEHSGFPRDLPLGVVYTTGILGPELARDAVGAMNERPQSPFSPQNHELCPQNFFDPVMQKAAASYAGNQILFHHRLAEFEDRGDHVLARLEAADGGPSVNVRAQYLAACDGAGSFVANQLGVTPKNPRLLSNSTNIFIRCPELARRAGDRRAYRYMLIGAEGTWGTIVNIDGRDIWRLQLLGDETWPAWSDAEIQAFVRRGIGADVPFEVFSWTPWARRAFVVDQYRVGRCFLVGDSAHQLSPTGGYGMNTGIAEAVDFGWKVDAILSGWGGASLLDSYDAERRPAAIRNVAQASENLAAMRSVPAEPRLLDLDAAGAEVREAMGALTQKVMQREWLSFGIHLGAVYWDSPIIAHETPRPPQDDVAAYVQRAYPGSRAPHAWLSTDKSTLDLFGRGFVLLDFSQSDAPGLSELTAAAVRVGLPLEHVRIAEPHAAELYERTYVLVRPDGYIAWRGDALPDKPDALVDLVRGEAAALQA